MKVPYMFGHPVDMDGLWVNHTCNVPTCIRACAQSIQGLYPDLIAHVVSNLQLFGLIWSECINTFQSDFVVMNQVGRSSQQCHIILWGNIVPIRCFHYEALILHCNSFQHCSVMPLLERTCTQQKCNRTSHSLRKSLKCLLQNAVIINEYFCLCAVLAE